MKYKTVKEGFTKEAIKEFESKVNEIFPDMKYTFDIVKSEPLTIAMTLNNGTILVYPEEGDEVSDIPFHTLKQAMQMLHDTAITYKMESKK